MLGRPPTTQVVLHQKVWRHSVAPCLTGFLQCHRGVTLHSCWVHANGGIINGGVACVCAKWRVFVHFCAVFAHFCAFLCVFSYQNGLQKSANWRITLQKCAKSAFYAIPPLVIPPFACHATLLIMDAVAPSFSRERGSVTSESALVQWRATPLIHWATQSRCRPASDQWKAEET